MKIYFAGSIRGGRDDVKLYAQLIDHLKQYGEVLTEHVGNTALQSKGESHLTDPQIHNRDLDWILQSDVIVAEVTATSLGVGYELGITVKHNEHTDNKIRILCLYRPQEGKKLSAMINGSPTVTNATYQTLDEAKKLIDDFLT